jgi:hypothetical protein
MREAMGRVERISIRCATSGKKQDKPFPVLRIAIAHAMPRIFKLVVCGFHPA